MYKSKGQFLDGHLKKAESAGVTKKKYDLIQIL